MESYYSQNREKTLEYQKKRNLQLKDEISRYNAEYYIKHKDEILEKHKANHEHNSIVRKLRRLQKKVDYLNDLTKSLLNNHKNSNTTNNNTNKNTNKKHSSTTIDTVSIEFD